MFFRTIEQVRRFFRILAGFTLLLVGVIMLFTRPRVAGCFSWTHAAGGGVRLGQASDGPHEARE